MSDKAVVFDPVMHKHLDAVTLVLLYNNQNSLLPDLYEIFGDEALVKFIDIFGGTTIRVPSRDDLANAVRDVNIYLTLKHNRAKVEDLASQYRLTNTVIEDIFLKVTSAVESDLQMSIKSL